MSCVQCSVMPDTHKGWLAAIEHRTAGPYLNRDMALRVAIDDAQRIRRSGRAARVVVYDAEREVCAEYCLCRPCACKETD